MGKGTGKRVSWAALQYPDVRLISKRLSLYRY